MLFDEIFLFDSFNLHQLTFIFKVLFCAEKVMKFKNKKTNWLSGFLLQIEVGHLGSFFTTFFLSKKLSLIGNDFNIYCHLIIWTLFFYSKITFEFYQKLMKFKFFYFSTNVLNECRRALSMIQGIKMYKLNSNFIWIFPAFDCGLSLVASSLFFPFFSNLLIKKDEKYKINDLYFPSFKFLLPFICGFIFQIFYKTGYELIIEFSICLVFSYVQIKDMLK